jgi:predicted membrane channel-forming protein YqfA (hemolysin III family)
MERDGVLRIDFFHSDNCGGVSRFGTINMIVMMIFTCILIVILALLETHNYRHRTTTVPLFCTSAGLILLSVGTVFYLHKAVQQQRRAALVRVNAMLNKSLDGPLSREEFPNHLLGIRSHLLALKTYPYSGVARSAVNVLRAAPAVWALVRLVI